MVNTHKRMSDDLLSDLYKTLIERKLSIQNTNQSRRVLNHWVKQGILQDEEPIQGKWRRFSLVDIIWLSIIDDLRSFGMGLQSIKCIYEHQVTKKHQPHDILPGALSNLEQAILLIFQNKALQLLVTDNTGHSEILTEKEFKEKLAIGSIQNHLIISINRMINENFEEIAFAPLPDSNQLTKEERDLLDIIRNENFLSIKVRLKDGQITMIEGVERMANKKRIIEILQEGRFQDIELKQENGKVVSVHRTLKKKY